MSNRVLGALLLGALFWAIAVASVIASIIITGPTL